MESQMSEGEKPHGQFRTTPGRGIYLVADPSRMPDLLAASSQSTKSLDLDCCRMNWYHHDTAQEHPPPLPWSATHPLYHIPGPWDCVPVPGYLPPPAALNAGAGPAHHHAHFKGLCAPVYLGRSGEEPAGCSSPLPSEVIHSRYGHGFDSPRLPPPPLVHEAECSLKARAGGLPGIAGEAPRYLAGFGQYRLPLASHSHQETCATTAVCGANSHKFPPVAAGEAAMFEFHANSSREDGSQWQHQHPVALDIRPAVCRLTDLQTTIHLPTAPLR